MRMICDTNVLISALIWGGTPGKIWDRVESGADRLFVSQPMLDELARVLGYPRIARVLLLRALQPGDILSAVVRAADVVWPRALAAPVVRDDPDDDAVLACAAAAAAEFVITGDEHLLSMGEWDGIRLVTPFAYLEAVDKGTETKR